MSFLKNIVNQFKRRVFDSIIDNNLIYNTCWEDPKVDRQLLDLNEDSTVVTLTSAGCNPLDYLLDNPAQIHCIDINPAQNALLELKRSLFTAGDYPMLWSMFGEGQYAAAMMLYQNKLRANLPPYAQEFWDQHISYFSPYSKTPSFYFRGTAGAFAYIIQKRLHRKGLQQSVYQLLNAQSIDEQRYYFEEIEPHLWNAFSRWLLQRSTTMALLGVPHGQRALIKNEVSGGLPAFIQQSIKDIFTSRAIVDNYFWHVYLTGSYSNECCPNYLKDDHFDTLKKRSPRLNVNTCSLIHFLRSNPGTYSHFNLLDHQDWMVQHQKAKVSSEWKLLLQNSQIGTKILFRSASTSRSFIPDFVNNHVRFKDKIASHWHTKDRVGTYGSTHLAIVDNPLS